MLKVISSTSFQDKTEKQTTCTADNCMFLKTVTKCNERIAHAVMLMFPAQYTLCIMDDHPVEEENAPRASRADDE